jgi:hypothetical protein
MVHGGRKQGSLHREMRTREGPSVVRFLSRFVCGSHLALAILAEKQWISNSWDFRTAFLQGKSLTREIFVVPPIDSVGSHVVSRLKKPIYGIVSALKSWFDRLIEVCRASILTTATTNEGLLIMTSGEQVVGVLALHVNEAIGGGTEEFHDVMAKIG